MCSITTLFYSWGIIIIQLLYFFSVRLSVSICFRKIGKRCVVIKLFCYLHANKGKLPDVSNISILQTLLVIQTLGQRHRGKNKDQIDAKRLFLLIDNFSYFNIFIVAKKERTRQISFGMIRFMFSCVELIHRIQLQNGLLLLVLTYLNTTFRYLYIGIT